MSKNIKRIVIAVGAVVIIALALVVLKYVFPEDVVEPIPSAEATEEPVYYLVHRSGSDVVGFRSNYSDGSVFTIDIETNEDGTYSYHAEPEDEFFGYNTSRFRSMMYTMTSLTATSKIEEDPEDLSVYGLEEPQFYLDTLFSDGTSSRLYIGNETPVKNYYYAMTDQDNTVYTIGNYITGLIMREPYEFRQIDSFPKYEEDEIYENINHFTMTRRDGVAIDIVLDEDLSMEGNISSSPYMMTSPFVSPCNSEAIEANLDIVATVTYNSIVEDITADRLAEYGMDKPAGLFVEDKAGNSLDLRIGTENGGSCYCAIGRQYDAFMAGEVEHLTILSFSISEFDWIDMNYMSLQIRTPWIVDIHDVASLTYDFDGDVYQMDLYEYDDVTGSGVDVVRTCSYINGKDVNETNTKRIYGRTLNFRQVGALSEDTVYDADYSYSIKIVQKDGTEHLMTFHKINERQFACVVDGVAEYYVYASNITTLTTAMERAMDDREVSLVYQN